MDSAPLLLPRIPTNTTWPRESNAGAPTLAPPSTTSVELFTRFVEYTSMAQLEKSAWQLVTATSDEALE